MGGVENRKTDMGEMDNSELEWSGRFEDWA